MCIRDSGNARKQLKAYMQQDPRIHWYGSVSREIALQKQREDVNKRQEKELVDAAAQKKIKVYGLSAYTAVQNQESPGAHIILGFAGIPEEKLIAGPVSYTHLDVYKRQH